MTGRLIGRARPALASASFWPSLGTGLAPGKDALGDLVALGGIEHLAPAADSSLGSRRGQPR